MLQYRAAESPGRLSGRYPVASVDVTNRKTRNHEACTRIGMPSALPISHDGHCIAHRTSRLNWRSTMAFPSGILVVMHMTPAFRLLLICVAFGLAIFRPAPGTAQVITSGPSFCPGVALTFDLCPVRKGPGYDPAIVEYLAEHRIPATFFMSG